MPNLPTATFNSYDLASVVPGLKIISTNPYRQADRKLSFSDVANANKGVTTSSYNKSKKLNLIVEISQNTRELLDDAIDALKKYVLPREKLLVLSQGSGTRQWTASYSNMSFSDVYGGHATVDIEFIAADGVGVDVASTNLFSTSLTGANSNTPFVGQVGGTMEWQQPIITITLTAVSGGTGGTMIIGNPDNGMQATITGNFATGDVIVLDSRTKKVTLNGGEISYQGSVPEWALGAGSIDYVDNFTTRTRTMSGLYYKRYA